MLSIFPNIVVKQQGRHLSGNSFYKWTFNQWPHCWDIDIKILFKRTTNLYEFFCWVLGQMEKRQTQSRGPSKPELLQHSEEISTTIWHSLESPHVLSWLPECSLSFGLFWSSPTSQILLLPFFLAQRMISLLDLPLPLVLPPLPLPKSPLSLEKQLPMSLLLFHIQEQLQGRVLPGGFSGEGLPTVSPPVWVRTHLVL